MIDPKLSGKVAIVTGTDDPRGIGAAIAAALERQGVSMLRHSLHEGPGRSALDLAEPSSVGKLFDAAEQSLGPVDLLVNNAARCVPDTLEPEAVNGVAGEAAPLAADEAGRHFAVNAAAPALLMTELARRLAAAGRRAGAVVNVSTDGSSGHAGAASYGASKRALESYSLAAAWELAPRGIRVNVVSPGPIQTGWIGPELEERVVESTPLGRLGAPEDVADVVVFFCSEQARWLTGQVLYVGGGHRMPG